ncbi:hypothetical protein R5W23_006266 [Gemmata sp. JC673]|uniref:Uncharacterized protein n=1 Tax=Gemmata algarum TaxID=2975278 RepID=A0ABU5EZG1_9BACT|nr:hypothetical protein [Gemmata algarum]MDY3559076.1 hypothetical protein [Gemmata algarum]
MSRLLACLTLAVGAGPLLACLNDVELPAHEREFRSQYRSSNPPPVAPSSEPTDRPSTRFMFGAGAALLVAACVLVLVTPRTRS